MEGYKQFVVKVFMIVLMVFLAFIGRTQGMICCFRDPCCCQFCSDGGHFQYHHIPHGIGLPTNTPIETGLPPNSPIEIGKNI